MKRREKVRPDGASETRGLFMPIHVASAFPEILAPAFAAGLGVVESPASRFVFNRSPVLSANWRHSCSRFRESAATTTPIFAEGLDGLGVLSVDVEKCSRGSTPTRIHRGYPASQSRRGSIRAGCSARLSRGLRLLRETMSGWRICLADVCRGRTRDDASRVVAI